MSIRDFRNYKSLDIDFNSRLTFFIGENGEGKTNFLESIQMLSTLKSFRDNSDDEILSWNSDTFYISGSITKDIHDIKLELGYTKKESKRKKIKLNGNEISKKIDFIGNLVTVVFSPLDLLIESSTSFLLLLSVIVFIKLLISVSAGSFFSLPNNL